ncbi:MAG TPA: energy-coupling factor transporter transmembrane component T [Candidatus Binatia bacterium]|nr:energy-coupling factor transporter transmembrane component T [Candidatus Binatia bacterium]
MNPRALAVWSAAGLVIALSTGNPAYRAIVLLCGLNLVAARGRPGVSARPLLFGAGIAALIATLLTLLLSHTGAHVLFRLSPGIPAIGGAFTLEALAFGLATGLGIAAVVLAVAPLTLVCEPHELVDALPRPLARTGAAVGAALNLIPGTIRSAREIRDAQRMRGWRAGRVADWPAVAVPVVLTALEGSLTLAEAMEARGYGAQSRTHLATTAWRAGDTAVAVVSGSAAAMFLVLRFSGGAPDWYPFPLLSAPPVTIAAISCCACLVIPVLWPRR